MATLFERLDEEEAIVRGELDALREKVQAGEERLARLTITRETALQLLGDPVASPERDEPRTVAVTASESAAESRVGANSSETKLATLRHALSRSGASAPPVPAAAVPVVPQRVEWTEGLERITVLLATSGRVMRTREVAAAIGEDVTLPARIETTRGRLKRLVKDGTVVELEPGCFRIASIAAARGEAPGTR
jgi:hypothetical protein